MASTPTAAHLRYLAASLRRLSSLMSEVPVGGARSLAMADTWLGPAAGACHDALAHHERMITWHVDQLTGSARRLDREADQLDSLAAAPTGVQ
jgi:hypothetical protein